MENPTGQAGCIARSDWRCAGGHGRRRAIGVRTPLALPQGPNQRWSLNFMADPNGRRFRILTVVDTSLPGRSTVDARVKKGVAKAELPAMQNATIGVAAGVVMGNEIHVGGGM